MRTIVLIGCSKRKLSKKAKAKDLYIGSLFRKSYNYAVYLKPDKLFILSALHHLVSPIKRIEPYNVTLASVSTKNRGNLIVLNKLEKKAWGNKVVKQLEKECNLQNDRIIILAGNEYINPIKTKIGNLVLPMQGLTIGKKLAFLTRNLKK